MELKNKMHTNPNLREDFQYSTPRRDAYATVMEWGVRVSYLLLLGCFFLYIFEILPPSVPIASLTQHWEVSAAEYMRLSGGGGWHWLEHLHQGDHLNLLPIAMLGSLTIVCYLVVLPFFIRERDRYLLSFAILQIIVLLLAASGIVAGGH